MKLRIDAERCEGHGRCYEVAPTLVDADERGRGTVIVEDVDAASFEAAQAAVNACPERAVSLTPDRQ